MKVDPSVYHEFCNLFESFRGHVVTVKLSIYDRLGGENAIANISEKLYSKVIVDDRIKYFFTSTDMTRLKEMQKNFLMSATGGPKKYTGKNLKEAHANIKINDIHFNAFKENLLLTLKELLVDPQTF
jgi:hemoglobin